MTATWGTGHWVLPHTGWGLTLRLWHPHTLYQCLCVDRVGAGIEDSPGEESRKTPDADFGARWVWTCTELSTTATVEAEAGWCNMTLSTRGIYCTDAAKEQLGEQTGRNHHDFLSCLKTAITTTCLKLVAFFFTEPNTEKQFACISFTSSKSRILTSTCLQLLTVLRA